MKSQTAERPAGTGTAESSGEALQSGAEPSLARNRCIVMFVKYPEKGKVKSRLSLELDAGFVVALYECFVADLLTTLEQTGVPFRLAFTPPDREEEVGRRFGRRDFIPQAGGDLGERMKNAFNRCFADGFDDVVVIGSDIPDLPAAILAGAFAALDQGGTVVGPTADGGYCLIGFRREMFVPEVFDGIDWGTRLVLQQTLERLEGAGVGVHRLPPWRDVDTPGDLRELVCRHRNTPFARSRTMACLRAASPEALSGVPTGARPLAGIG